MRKSFYIYSVVGALLSLLCMVNCTDRELFQGQHADGVAGFSLQEAKEYFEEQAGTEPVMTRSAGRAALDPGDFAPYWESAVASSQCRLGSYDVPIAPGLSVQGGCGRWKRTRRQGGSGTCTDCP